MRLESKIAIVTGGGGGIGSGICRCLAREGADIVISDIDTEKAQKVVDELEAMGRRALAVRSDVTDGSSCDNLVARSIEAFGQVDIVVNNAGHYGTHVGGAVTDHPISTWDDNYDINVKGPFLLCRSTVDHMKERRSGKIINISSVAAKRDPAFLPAYAAAKNALLSLTRLLAKDLGPHNINVNAICPGMLWTSFWESLAPELAKTVQAFAELEPREAFKQYVASVAPLQREQTPEDIGNLVAFLASEEARNITGQAINVDGGVAMG